MTHELTSQELATILFHYAKRRGTTLEMIEEDDEKNKKLGEAKAVLNENDHQLKQGLYVCQVQNLNFEKYGSVRCYYHKFRTIDYVFLN